jgi:tetratricopeptide (TPR) repeat protein
MTVQKKYGLSIALMLLVTLITYSNHFLNAFHFDDSHSVQNNPWIRNINNVPLFFKDGTTSSVLPQNQSYRPVVTTSLAFDYWLGNGYNPFYFHLSIFILFLLQGILMFLLYKKVYRSASSKNSSVYIALIATTWYLLHPAIAETVNYVIARSDLISTFFVLLGFVLYSYSPFCKRTLLYLLPVGVGALAKPTAVMFAPMLLVYVLLFEADLSFTDIFKKQNTKQMGQVILRVLPAFIFCGLMYLLIDKFTPKTWQAGGTSSFQYIITQPFVILHYFGTLFLPTGLSADSDWTLLPGIGDIRFIIGCVFILLMLILAWYTSIKKILRPISFGICWFFLALIPTSVIPLAEVLNDHRVFFPFIGLIMSVGWAIGLLVIKIMKKGKFAVTAFIVPMILLLSAYAYGTYNRNKVWHTEESLWYDVTIKSPQNGRGLMNYGLSQMQKANYQVAEKYFTRALQLLPNYYALNVNMGILKAATGDKATAEKYFLSAIQTGSNYQDPYYFYGRFLNEQQRYNEAITQLTKAMSISPGYLSARLLLMDVYDTMEYWDRLKALANSTLIISPNNPEVLKHLQSAQNQKGKLAIEAEKVAAAPTAEKYLNLSLLYFNTGKYEQCIEAANQAIKLKPGYDLAYNNICAAYNKLGQWDKAIDAGKQGLKFNPNNQLLKNNLQEAYKRAVK